MPMIGGTRCTRSVFRCLQATHLISPKLPNSKMAAAQPTVATLASKLASSSVSTRSATPGGTLRERDAQVSLVSYANLHQHKQTGPNLVATKGKGIYVYDEDGQELIEAMAGLWCTSLGWGEERLIKAAEE